MTIRGEGSVMNAIRTGQGRDLSASLSGIFCLDCCCFSHLSFLPSPFLWGENPRTRHLLSPDAYILSQAYVLRSSDLLHFYSTLWQGTSPVVTLASVTRH